MGRKPSHHADLQALTATVTGLKVASAMGPMWWLVALSGLAFAQPAPAPPTTAPTPTPTPPGADRPVRVIPAPKGFIDDPIAVDGEGARLAFIRTDSASFARLEIVDLRSGAPRASFAVGDPQQLFERVVFAGASGGIVVITRDPGSDRRSAQHFSPEGRALGHAGPATDFGVTTRGERAYLVSWDRRTLASGATTYVVGQHRLDGLTRSGKPRGYTVGKDGQLAQPAMKMLGWQDGYSQIVGQKAGAYDKAKDFRQPDRAAVIDALDGRTVVDADIGDLMAWATGNLLRRQRPNRSLFVVLSDGEDAVLLSDPFGRRVELALAGTFSHYDPRTLTEQEDPGGRTLYFSFETDPLHPEALARRKAEPAFIDVYRARMRAPPDAKAAPAVETRRLVRAALGDRRAAWAASEAYVILLRKHKSFSRGGNELEVYEVATSLK